MKPCDDTMHVSGDAFDAQVLEATQINLVGLAERLHERLDTLTGSDENTLWRRAKIQKVLVALGEVFDELEREKRDER